MVSVQINGQQLDMELDTGAAVSVISENTFQSFLKDSVTIQPSNIMLRTYLGKELPILGTANVDVTYETQKVSLPLVVVKGEGASLFGQNWLQYICLNSVNWGTINHLDNDRSIQELIDQHPGLLRSKLGTLNGVEAKCSFHLILNLISISHIQ